MDWYDVFKAARKIGSKEEKRDGKRFLVAAPFTAAQLAIAAKLKGTSKSTPQRIASAWIGKFVRWGYAATYETAKSTGGRPPVIYVLTKWGLKFRRRAQKRRVAANEPEKR